MFIPQINKNKYYNNERFRENLKLQQYKRILNLTKTKLYEPDSKSVYLWIFQPDKQISNDLLTHWNKAWITCVAFSQCKYCTSGKYAGIALPANSNLLNSRLDCSSVAASDSIRLPETGGVEGGFVPICNRSLTRVKRFLQTIVLRKLRRSLKAPPLLPRLHFCSVNTLWLN